MLVLVAVLLGVAVVFLVNSKFAEYEQKAKVPTRKLYKAAADVKPGGTVQEALEKTKLLQAVDEVPQAFADSTPDFVDTEIEWAKKLTITRGLRAGDYLRMSHLQAQVAAELPATIPEGMKLFTMSVDQQSSVGYLVAPGDRVDVYAVWTKPDPKEPGGLAVETANVVDDALVFAVDNTIMSRDGTLVRLRGASYSSVTFALSPADFDKAIVAAKRGKLSLTLKARKPA
jgi:Flp pilus assembly protein CpaB